MSSTDIIRTRFAPSPSGHLHVGGARTALFAWAYAKSENGRFILRIEDTDQKRSSDAASMAFLEDLAWLGIDWDEGPSFEGRGGGDFGPYYQSERREIYDRSVEQLLAEGKAYHAFETPEELDQKRRAATAAGKSYHYDRAALAVPPETVRAWLAEGRPHVVRLRVPDQDVVVHDTVLGEVRTQAGILDDFVIRKADGFPTYHFAVVIDDELMGVTHVIRGQEHLSNTPRHVLLQTALGFRTPVYAHIALIFNPDGSKMSKRDRDRALRAAVREKKLTSASSVDPATFSEWLSTPERQLDLETAEHLARELRVSLPEINVDDFRRAGYLPDILVNYLALLGWSPGGDIEKFNRQFLVEHFDLGRLAKSPARFDREKLLAFNIAALNEMSDDEFADRYRAHCERYHPEFVEKLTRDEFELLARANHTRARTLDDTIESSRFLLLADEEIEYASSKPVRKALAKGDPSGFDHLVAIRPVLAALPDWNLPAIESAVRDYAESQTGGKLGKIGQPLRVAISGGPISPPIFESLTILGRDSVLNRIDRCLDHREAISAG